MYLLACFYNFYHTRYLLYCTESQYHIHHCCVHIRMFIIQQNILNKHKKYLFSVSLLLISLNFLFQLFIIKIIPCFPSILALCRVLCIEWCWVSCRALESLRVIYLWIKSFSFLNKGVLYIDLLKMPNNLINLFYVAKFMINSNY